MCYNDVVVFQRCCGQMVAILGDLMVVQQLAGTISPTSSPIRLFSTQITTRRAFQAPTDRNNNWILEEIWKFDNRGFIDNRRITD